MTEVSEVGRLSCVSVCQYWRDCRDGPFEIVVHFDGLCFMFGFVEWCGFVDVVLHVYCRVGVVRAICSLYVRWTDGYFRFNMRAEPG